jgi:phospholipase C
VTQRNDGAGSVAPAKRLSRRQFLQSTTIAAATAALGGLSRPGRSSGQVVSLPPPDESGIEHIIVVMMENRSFDHFLGWLDGADGRQAGLRYTDGNGAAHRTHRLSPDFQGCEHPDPDHSYVGGRIELNGGACDGWLRAGDNDEYAIGYYAKKDLAFFGSAAPQWTVCDRYFSAIMAETFPNRFYQHAAQTDRLRNTSEISFLPTIWDRLAEAGLEGRYYFSDVPFLALWGTQYLPIGHLIPEFFADAAAGTLPHVSFVDPRFLGQEFGLSNDDHPHADIRNGQAFMNSIYQAVISSPAWARTVLVFNYDEWGGFFEHVPSPSASIPPADQAAGNEDGLLGFRVPSLLVSPFARREHVSHMTFDHTSLLRMIEWRWGLAPLTIRDATANNFALALDFSNPVLTAKRFNVPTGPFGAPCLPPGTVPVPDKWDQLRVIATVAGWPR